MITRAQAEALLTLAESLEACERLGLDLTTGPDGEMMLEHPAGTYLLCGLGGESIRNATAELLK